MSNKLEDLGKTLQDKSTDLATMIDMIKIAIYGIDMEHLKNAIKTFYNQASFQESAAILNPSYNPVKNDLLKQQAKSLQHLYDFIEGLKKCDELKGKVAEGDERILQTQKLFW